MVTIISDKDLHTCNCPSGGVLYILLSHLARRTSASRDGLAQWSGNGTRSLHKCALAQDRCRTGYAGDAVAKGSPTYGEFAADQSLSCRRRSRRQRGLGGGVQRIRAHEEDARLGSVLARVLRGFLSSAWSEPCGSDQRFLR